LAGKNVSEMTYFVCQVGHKTLTRSAGAMWNSCFYVATLTCHQCTIPPVTAVNCVVLACSIEANQMEDRAMNKMWLVRHLEVTRQLVLEDLRVVKVKHPVCLLI